MAGKVVHFEIAIDDTERGPRFYRDAFGWQLDRFGPMDYWTTTAGEGEGIGGALTLRREDDPGLMIYVAVDAIEDSLVAVEAAGGRRLTEATPIPGVGWTARFGDTEGNVLGLFQADPAAG